MTLVHYTATVRPDRLLELPREAQYLMKPGQKIEIDINLDDTTAQASPNEEFLTMLRDVAELTKNIPETDPSQTNRLIREARAGAMYGYEPTE